MPDLYVRLKFEHSGVEWCLANGAQIWRTAHLFGKVQPTILLNDVDEIEWHFLPNPVSRQTFAWRTQFGEIGPKSTSFRKKVRT